MRKTNLQAFGKFASLAAIGCFFVSLNATPMAQQPAGGRSSIKAPTAEDRNVVAYVNGTPIYRTELAEELLARRGKEQLELLINRKIIELACQKAGIQVTDTEVEKEINDVIKSVGAGDARTFEEKVLRDRHSTLVEYRSDVVRPSIAMRKLAGGRVKVTEADIQKAYEANYGEKVRCRLILFTKEQEALRAYPELRKDKDAFIRAATQQEDTNLAANGGLRFVNHHYAFEAIEKEAFRLRDGEISQVIQFPLGYVIFLREGLESAKKTVKLEQVRDALEKDIAEKKLQVELPKLFKELKEQAMVKDYLNNKTDLPNPARKPAASKATPTAAQQ